jgi:hypothetical protein
MNVYITGTPEIKTSLIQVVVDTLNKVKGPLNFNRIDKVAQKRFDDLLGLNYKERGISFKQLNDVANAERKYFQFYNTDFYVILTSNKLDYTFFGGKTWFSYFNQKNIFVRTYGWEEHTPGKPHIAISHQVIENIFQSISGYEYEKLDYYHDRAKGCLNDFCKNEYEIEFKLRAGHICRNCLDIAVDNGATIEIIGQISRYLEYFREELLEFKSVLNEIKIPKMRISERGEIFIGNKEIELDYIHKTFYIFSIQNRGEPISIEFLRSRIDEFRNIYFALKKTGSDKAVQTFMGFSVDNKGITTVKRDVDKMKKYIKDRRSEIKIKIMEVVGEELSELFKIGSFSKLDYSQIRQYYSLMPENSRVEIEIEDGLLELIG